MHACSVAGAFLLGTLYIFQSISLGLTAQVQKLGKGLHLFYFQLLNYLYLIFWIVHWAVPFLVARISYPLWAPHPINHLYSSLWLRPYRLTFQSCCCVHVSGYLYYLTSIIWGILSSHLLSSGLKSLTKTALTKRGQPPLSFSVILGLSGSTFIALVTECPLGL